MLRLFCFFLGLVAAVSGACRDIFQQLGEGCYYFSYQDNIVSDSWDGARQLCQRLGDDVDLAVLDYLCDDYTHVANYLLREDVYETVPTTMFIGGDGYSSSWFWVDGRAISPNSIYWYENEPTSGSYCLILYSATPHTYRKIFIYGDTCSARYSFVCQENVQGRR